MNVFMHATQERRCKVMSQILPSQTNLLLQIIILAICFGSLALKRQRKYFLHGATMLIAVLLNILSFGLVMLPRLAELEILRMQPFHTISLIIFAHSSLGFLTIVLGIGLIFSWHLRSSTQNCAKRKRLMRHTLIVWLVTVFLGILLYTYLYTSLIP